MGISCNVIDVQTVKLKEMKPEWAKRTENQQEKQNLTVFENCFSGVTD